MYFLCTNQCLTSYAVVLRSLSRIPNSKEHQSNPWCSLWWTTFSHKQLSASGKWWNTSSLKRNWGHCLLLGCARRWVRWYCFDQASLKSRISLKTKPFLWNIDEFALPLLQFNYRTGPTKWSVVSIIDQSVKFWWKQDKVNCSENISLHKTSSSHTIFDPPCIRKCFFKIKPFV